MSHEIPPGLIAAGVGYTQARAPAAVTAAWLASENERNERILRLQYPDGELPLEWEAELKTLERQDTTSQLQRWAFLKHLWRVWNQRLQPVGQDKVDRDVSARQLLRREPVVVWLNEHRVEVTGRSYSAMAEIAVHDMTVKALREDLTHIAALVADLRTRMAATEPYKIAARNKLRRRLKRLSSLFQRAYTERELHRCAIYAHALTPDGAPAEDPGDAPAWWREMRPEDDAALLMALLEAGPVRYARLGRQPQPREERTNDFIEDLGYASLFSAFEQRSKLMPGELYDRDLAQLLTAIRASATEFASDSDLADEMGG